MTFSVSSAIYPFLLAVDSEREHLIYFVKAQSPLTLFKFTNKGQPNF